VSVVSAARHLASLPPSYLVVLAAGVMLVVLAALRAVGAVLRSTVRQSDLCARFAGDEFIVVLWDCSPEHEARRVADVQNAVSAYPFEPRPGVRVSLSISAGPARFPEDGNTFEDLLAAADERMYRDKAGRRSRNSRRHDLPAAERA